MPEESDEAVLELVRGEATIFYNLSDRSQSIPEMAGAAMLFSSEFSRYEGARIEERMGVGLLPFECIAFGPAQWKQR
jgi:hypothetical protein